MRAMKRALWVGSRRCIISWTMMYSRHWLGFLARSVLSRMLEEETLQLPQRVRMRWMKKRLTLTPRMGSQRAIKEGTSSLICSRYQRSMICWRCLAGVLGRTVNNILRDLISIEGGSFFSTTESKYRRPHR